MAKRSPRFSEMREKCELSCASGLSDVLESCQGHTSRKLISNGRPANNHTIGTELLKKLDIGTSFDEECRKIKKSQASRKNSRKDYQSSVRSMNTLSNLNNQQASASAGASRNKINTASMLEAVCNQFWQKESLGPGKDITFPSYDQVEEFDMHLFQMGAKAFVDQMFIDRHFNREGRRSESRLFSDALEILNTNKDLFMKLLQDPNSMLTKYIKNLQNAHSRKETLESVSGVKFFHCGSQDEMGSDEPKNAMVLQQRKYPYGSSSRETFAPRPPNQIVVLKPTPQNVKVSEEITCHCSSLQPHHRLSNKAQNIKSSTFSFKEMKRKLRSSFGGKRKQPNKIFLDQISHKQGQNKRTREVNDEVISQARNIGKSADSSTDSKKNSRSCYEMSYEDNFKTSSGSELGCMTKTIRKKLDIPRTSFSQKQEFDVILEAKRHLAARLKNLNETEESTSERSPKTLGRVLALPERDFWHLSPKRDGGYGSPSAQMRYSPYSNSTARTCSSPSAKSPQVTSGDDSMKQDGEVQILDPFRSFPFSDTEVHECNGCAIDTVKFDGQGEMVQMNRISQPGNSSNQLDEEEDGHLMYSRLDSPENEASRSALGDSPSTLSEISQLDIAYRIKYQEEHLSPVSVLEPFLSEDLNSSPSTTPRTCSFAAGQQLQLHHLDFQESPMDPPIGKNSSTDEPDSIPSYVHSVLQASCLSWDELSSIRQLPEQLIDESLFEEVEFLPVDFHSEPKLLFDHINEVLSKVYDHHFGSISWLPCIKPKIMSVPLEEHVVDEVMEEADFYLLPRTEKRTLDMLVRKDLVNHASWLDLQLNTQEIVFHIAEDIIAEAMLDIVLESHA